MVRLLSGRSAHAALLHHVGKRSESAYATPQTAHRSEDTFIVPLPYGTEVDWLRNLQAAGQGVVRLEGGGFPAGIQPRVQNLRELPPLGFPRRSVRSKVFNRAAKKRLNYLEQRAGKTPGAEIVPASELRVGDFVLDDTKTHQYLELKGIREYALPDADLVLNLGDRTMVFATLDMPFVRDRLEDLREMPEYWQDGTG